MIYFTSDHHFFHRRIREYENRPFASDEQMHEEMIRRWNDVVGVNDHVFHLGDLAFGSAENVKQLLSRLNGFIILVKGNHDRGAPVYLKNGVDYCKSRQVPLYPLSMVAILIHDATTLPMPNKRDIIIAGHSHSQKPVLWFLDNTPVINVSVEHWDYTPIPMTKIVELIYENNLYYGCPCNIAAAEKSD